MKIIVLTPIYTTTTNGISGTPVVHYFAREWVKMGHEVVVFHLAPKYPFFFYWISRLFQHRLNTRFGITVPLESPYENEYEAEGVLVKRICLRKFKPHSRYSSKQLKHAFDAISKECEKNGIPEWFIAHWDNPCLELLSALKNKFGNKSCLVLHGIEYNFEKLYGEEGFKLLSQIDVLGFRSLTGKNNYLRTYGTPEHSFVASSGVSDKFIEAGKNNNLDFNKETFNYVYVGALISRKHPKAVLKALTKAYPKGNFSMTYIGDGAERQKIEEEYLRLGKIGTLRFTGRIPRDEIINYLKEADFFVMISQHETFGLVYLEAMAFGLIPIGSRNGGIDGIIVDGENGFLCESGNEEELAIILQRIKEMPIEELNILSRNAKETAQEYSDSGVAEKYINTLLTNN